MKFPNVGNAKKETRAAQADAKAQGQEVEAGLQSDGVFGVSAGDARALAGE